jgi:protein-tyrosine kinase
MLSLFHRVDTALGPRAGRSLLFIAANPGAGSSSVAHGYSQVAIQAADRRVLLVDASEPGPHETVPQKTISETIVAGERVTETAQLLGGGLYHNLLMRHGTQERTASLLKEERYWRSLVSEFDEVVIDTPAVTESQLGLVISSLVDGVVVVVEAEETQKSQVRHLVDDLRTFRARLLGTVFNKRRYYLPRWMYRHL